MTEQEQQNLFSEMFEERAAVREFEGGQSREDAEEAARKETQTAIFRCLVRQMIRWSKEGRRQDVVRWLDRADVGTCRDPAERKVYADAINQQINLGNDGSAGVWKE